MSNISKYSAEVKKYKNKLKFPILKKSKDRQGNNLYNKTNFQKAIWELKHDGYTIEDTAGILSELCGVPIPKDSIITYYYRRKVSKDKTPLDLEREALKEAMENNKFTLVSYVEEQLVSAILSTMDKANLIHEVSRYYSERSIDIDNMTEDERKELAAIAMQYEKHGIYKELSDLMEILKKRIGTDTTNSEEYEKMLKEVKRLNDGETRNTKDTSQ
jgi:hypothetical protein